MGSFKRSLFGYRRPEVDVAIETRDIRISDLEADAQRQLCAVGELEGEATSLAGMVIEREREIRVIGERLREANECHDRSIASLDAVTARLEDLQAQARGQATRIRMKALREAVEVSKRVQALTEAHPDSNGTGANGAAANGASPNGAAANGASPNGASPEPPAPAAEGDLFDGFFEGRVRLEIGPLGDFSQLVGFEDAVGQLGASEISVERFSEGRATLSMRLDQPVELLRELEERSALDFRVRHTAPDNLILDVDEDQGPEQRAA
jgi:hypothetical protein